MAGWLNKYEQGGLVLKKKTKDNYGKKENANAGYSTAGPGWVGEGTTNRGFNYNGAWGGTMQMGGSMPGAVGFMYARTQDPAPSNGKYAKKTKASAQDGTDLQKEWLVSYLKSPKYKERLGKEFAGQSDEFIQQENETRLNNLLNEKIKYVKSIGNSPGWISGMTIPKETKGQIYNNTDKKFIKNKWSPDTKGYDKKGTVYLENEYRPDNWNPSKGFETIPLHELGHAVDDAGYRIPTSTEKKIHSYTEWHPFSKSLNMPNYKNNGLTFDYYNTPSEFINRLQPIRYLLNKEGLYDTRDADFTEKDYDNMLKNKNINNNQHYIDVMKSLKGDKKQKKKAFVDLINTVAKNDNDESLDVAQNGKEMAFYQNGLDFKPKSISQDGKTIPNEKEEIKPITTSQRNIGQAAAWKIMETIKNNTPYQLSEDAVKSGIDPSLTCIGGVCNVYKDLGVDFSGVGNEKQGVRESRTKGKVVEYNPTFDKNYKAAGFEKVKGRPIEFNELTDIIQKGNLNPGDFIQYYNEKGIPDHTNIVLGSNPDGSVEVYNSYKHGQATRGESKEPYVYTLNPSAQGFKDKKINVFRVGDQKATEIRDASANDPSGITNTWFNYTMEKQIQRRMKMLEKDYQELAKQSGEPAKKLTPSQLRKAAIEEERRIYESDPMFKRNLETINTVDFSESPKEAMYRTLNKKKNGGWLDKYSEPIRDDRGQWAHPGEVTEIGSNDITMQGVDYPVLGISDTGDTQMMYPGEDYKFDGEKVTEYPMAQGGKKLKGKPTVKEIMEMPMPVEERYEPSKGVKNLKATLSGIDLATLPFIETPLGFVVNKAAGIANSVGDLYTSARYAADGQWGNAGIDAVEALLDLVPFAKGKRTYNLTKGSNLPPIYNKLSKVDKSLNRGLGVLKAGAYGDDFQDVIPESYKRKKQNGGWLNKYK
jgi:hypothetical protein